MPGPHPKPAHLRQRKNRKAGASMLEVPDEAPEVPELPKHPDGRDWHPYTVESWERAWTSAMASQWLESDFDGIFRLHMLYDQFYLKLRASILAEVRLQEQRYGLSPLDRTRLQWEFNRGDQAEAELRKRRQPPAAPVVGDPRALLRAVASK